MNPSDNGLVIKKGVLKRCWNKLDGKNWVALLQWQPRFADQCDWNRLAGKDWKELLRWHPQFADKCKLEKKSSEEWALLGWNLVAVGAVQITPPPETGLTSGQCLL